MKWWIHVKSIVTYLRKNSFLLRWNSYKQRFESLTRCCFWSTESKRDTHFKTLLSHWQMFMQNGEYTAFWYLQLLCYLRQLQFTIVQNEFVEVLVFSGQFAEFGRPERSASFVSIRPRLKSAYHLLTVVSDGAKSEKHLSSHFFG